MHGLAGMGLVYGFTRGLYPSVAVAWGAVIAAVAGAIGAAWVLHHAVERPAMAASRRVHVGP